MPSMTLGNLETLETVCQAAAIVRQEFERCFGRMLDDGKLWDDADDSGYPVDISEDGGAFTIEAELPGFKPNEINVSLCEQTVRITAERQREEENKIRHVAERRVTRVHRELRLPTMVDEESAEARLMDGVLVLRFPKPEPVGNPYLTLSF